MISAKSTIILKKFSYPRHKANASDQANLETEITQQSSDIILNVPDLIQYQLARCEESASLLARYRLDVHRPKQVNPHHMRNANNRQTGIRKAFEKPLR